MLIRTLLLALLLPASAAADAGEERPDCRDEPPLSRAAAELLLHRRPPSSEALMTAVRNAGSDAVGVRAFYFRTTDGSARDLLADVARKADAPLVCGFAQSDASRLLLVSARAGSIEPLSNETAEVRGEIGARFDHPELVIVDGDGELQRIALDRTQLARGIAISPELARPIRVQLLARGPAGPRPVAERVLHARTSNSAAASADEATPALGADGPDRSVAARLAALRKENRRQPLRDNQLLSRVASAHAGRVCAEGRVAHELAPGADPQQRLRDAGVQARRVGETVARAQSTAAAFAAFEHSPSHRLTLLEPDFTDAGVGNVQDANGRSCVVILLATWPRYVGR